jgi:hypothetical protein
MVGKEKMIRIRIKKRLQRTTYSPQPKAPAKML